MANNLRIKMLNKCLINTPFFLLPRFSANGVLQWRNYSRPTSFPDYFQNPVFRKDEQAKLIESTELSKLTAVPVKPPAVYETSSIYHDPLVNKVINHVMEMGKKQLARSLVEKAFENIKRTQIERYHLATTPDGKARIVLNPKEILHRAVENSKPLLQLSPIKRGGITYQYVSNYTSKLKKIVAGINASMTGTGGGLPQGGSLSEVDQRFLALMGQGFGETNPGVPGPITEKRSLFLAIKWLLEAANDKERTIHFPEQFARELIDAASNTGKVVKRKQDLHRQCEANRAYAHYRWQ